LSAEAVVVAVECREGLDFELTRRGLKALVLLLLVLLLPFLLLRLREVDDVVLGDFVARDDLLLVQWNGSEADASVCEKKNEISEGGAIANAKRSDKRKSRQQG